MVCKILNSVLPTMYLKIKIKNYLDCNNYKLYYAVLNLKA